MTVFIASIFLPYTIDFKATALQHARRRSTPSSTTSEECAPAVDRIDEGSRRGHLRQNSPSITSGTEHDTIFKPYASQSAAELPLADDPKGPRPNDPRLISWGHSRKFNQPRAKAAFLPDPSIVRRLDEEVETDSQLFLDGALDKPDSEEEQESPRALLSDVDWVVKAAEQGNGGLRNGIHAAVEAGLLKDRVWVGTVGMPTDSLKEETRASIAETMEDQWESLTVFVHDEEFLGHYAYFCHTILWPALHYQMQESPRRTEYDDYSWKQYLKINEAFANKIADHWRPGDSIWIHDYHLMLVPALLRKRLPSAKIGFFLHAAFPSSEIFRCLTARNALLNGLLGADLVAFQTDEYCTHFLHSCSRLLRLEVSAGEVHLKDRLVRVRSIPFGIDSKAIDELRSATEVESWIANICSRYQGKHLIVARDRLDGPGGIKQKLLAYEVFLKKYPKWRENVVLVQVASSASELPELEAVVSTIAMRVNSKYSTLTHQPLVLLRQDISYSQFLALLSVAEICMVTSLREGMNLTSHDFLNCQDGKLTSQCHGSLILSEFTGSAAIFNGHELLVNPWDYQQVADAISRTLEMTPEQKQRNWEFLMEKKTKSTALAWCESFQKALSEAHSEQLSREPNQLSALSIHALKESYEASRLRLFFLEDGGTIGSADPIASKKAIAQMKLLLQNPHNLVYVTSNKSPEQLELYLQDLPSGVGFIAENGCFHREINATTWEALLDDNRTKDWRNGVRKVMSYFQERTDGSWVEERRSSLTFWYNNAHDPEIATRQASELADQIAGSRGSEAIRVVLTDGTVTVEPSDVTKATAAELVLRRLTHKPDFLFVAGGTRGDEVLFRWANRLADSNTVRSVTTLTVGVHATEAKSILMDSMTISSVLYSLHAL